MPYTIARDPARMDLDVIHGFLSTCYWSPRLRREVLENAIRHSLVAGPFDEAGRQVGFARAVTDHATFAWLCDVFVLDPHRGHGLARRMVRALIDDPSCTTLRRWCLATRDAQGVYQPLGFQRIPPERTWMELLPPASNWQDPHPHTPPPS